MDGPSRVFYVRFPRPVKRNLSRSFEIFRDVTQRAARGRGPWASPRRRATVRPAGDPTLDRQDDAGKHVLSSHLERRQPIALQDPRVQPRPGHPEHVQSLEGSNPESGARKRRAQRLARVTTVVAERLVERPVERGMRRYQWCDGTLGCDRAARSARKRDRAHRAAPAPTTLRVCCVRPRRQNAPRAGQEHAGDESGTSKPNSDAEIVDDPRIGSFHHCYEWRQDA